MKNVIIINGAQCTGKTSKLNEILSEVSDANKLVVITKTFLKNSFKPNKSVQIIAVDEIASKNFVNCLAKAIVVNKNVVLVTTDNLSEVPKSYLSKANVITCNLSV